AGAITVPLLVLAAGSDWVVKRKVQQRFVQRVSSSTKHFEVLEGFSHAIFHEKSRHLVVGRVREFVEDCYRQPDSRPSLRHADREGFTYEEYQRMCAPGGRR